MKLYTRESPFGIQVTLVEPGVARTDFGGRSADQGEWLDVYDKMPVGDLYRSIRSGKFRVPGDSRKIAQAIVNSADQETAPYRFTLGSEAYELVHNALSMRIAALSAQKKLAFSTDADDLDRNSAKVVWK